MSGPAPHIAEPVDLERVNVPLDDQGRIADELPCLGCAYDLRMRPLESRCPECGMAVGRSAVGNLLRYAEPRWVRQMWEGLNCLSVLIASVIVLVGAWWLGYFEFGLMPVPEWTADVLPVTAMTVGPVLGLVGLWKLTRPEPQVARPPWYWSLRWWTRYSFIWLPAVFFAVRVSLDLLPFSVVHILLADQGTFFAWGQSYVSIPPQVQNGLVVTPLLLLPLVVTLYLRRVMKRTDLHRLRTALLATVVVGSFITVIYHLLMVHWFGWLNYAEMLIMGTPVGGPAQRAMYNPYAGRSQLSELLWSTVIWLLMAMGVWIVWLFIWTWRGMTAQARLAESTWAARQSENRHEQTSADTQA